MYKSLDSLESLCTFASRKTTSTNHNKKQQHENAKRTSKRLVQLQTALAKKLVTPTEYSNFYYNISQKIKELQ